MGIHEMVGSWGLMTDNGKQLDDGDLFNEGVTFLAFRVAPSMLTLCVLLIEFALLIDIVHAASTIVRAAPLLLVPGVGSHRLVGSSL